ncbi:DUF674 family protein [Senna tora]|uniref:DUF674 family protein n=1 Tax=Senna tora TaxID=362788 RepID=A0A834WLT2_9FABA|nr:DUF674 family protein [Senna tora]
MYSSGTPKHIPLRLMVDKERNRVLFAEAGKEFVDVLFSFMTLPLGTITRLVSEDSNLKAVRFGCISSLYESVGNLDHKYFCTNTCKDMLLHPRNPMEVHCQNLELNIDDTEPTKYFICPNFECRKKESVLLSTFRNQKCNCGSYLSSEITLSGEVTVTCEGFVQETTTFVILDDLSVISGDRKSITISETVYSPVTLLDPKSPVNGESSNGGGFVKGASMFMAMTLLKASLMSSSALTIGLSQLPKSIKEEK